MRLVVEGRLITPVISKKSQFIINGCKTTVNRPRRRHYTKINTSIPMYPYSFICYLGNIQLEYRHSSINRISHKIIEILEKIKTANNKEVLDKLKTIKGKFSDGTEEDHDFHGTTKARFIDPKFLNNGKITRLSEVDKEFKNKIEDFKKTYEKGFYVKLEV